MTAATSTAGFAPAVKPASFARIALVGSSGSGKLPAALNMALGFGGSIGVIDTTTHLYGSRYAGAGVPYSTMTMVSCQPAELIRAFAVAADARIDNLIIASMSSFWSGPGGMLEAVDEAGRASRDKNAGWSAMRPWERAMWAGLVAYPGNVLAIVRQKTDWLVDRDPDTGKVGARPVGLKPDQADGYADHFQHVLILEAGDAVVVKSPVPGLCGRLIHHPGPDLSTELEEWWAKDAVGERVAAADLRDWALQPERTIDDLGAAYLQLAATGQTGSLVLCDTDVAKRLLLTPIVDGVVEVGPLLRRRRIELAHQAKGTTPVNPGIEGAL